LRTDHVRCEIPPGPSLRTEISRCEISAGHRFRTDHVRCKIPPGPSLRTEISRCEIPPGPRFRTDHVRCEISTHQKISRNDESVAKDLNPRYLVRLLLAKETYVLSENCKRDLQNLTR